MTNFYLENKNRNVVAYMGISIVINLVFARIRSLIISGYLTFGNLRYFEAKIHQFYIKGYN